MPTAKVTWFFTFGEYGWTESLWQSYSSSLNELIPAAQNYAKIRAGLNAPGIAIVAVRISDDIIYRDSIYAPGQWLTGTNQGAGTGLIQTGEITVVPPAVKNQSPSNPFDAVQVRMESGSLYRREHMLRGLPKELFIQPPGPQLQGLNLMAFQAWSDELKAHWLFRVKSRSGPNQLYQVQSITSTGQISAQGQNFQAGNYVQMVGFRGHSGIRGKYFVANPGNPFTLTGFSNTTPIVKPIGYVQLLSTNGATLQPAYVPITSVLPITQTHRITGRPFGQPRGRRRAAALQG